MTDGSKVVASDLITNRHLVFLPDPHAEGVEGEIGRANQRRLQDAKARADKVAATERLLGPGESAPHGAVLEVALPISEQDCWKALGAIATYDDLKPGRITFGLDDADDSVDDQLPFATTFGLHRPLLSAIAEKTHHGASVVIHAVEWQLPSLYDFVADLETLGGRPCSAAIVFLRGAASHTEPANAQRDVLLVPIDSSIQFETGPLSSKTVGTSPDDSLYGLHNTGSLDVGHGIVARAGHPLTIESHQDEALVVRILLPVAPAWTDLVDVSSAAQFHPLLRADLPTRFDLPIESYGGSLYPELSSWRAEADAALSTRAHGLAAARARATIAQRPGLAVGIVTALAFRKDLSGPMRSPAHAGLVATRIDGELHLVAAGYYFSLPEGILNLLAPHLDGREVDSGYLLDRFASSGLTPHESRDLLRFLNQTELLEPIR